MSKKLTETKHNDSHTYVLDYDNITHFPKQQTGTKRCFGKGGVPMTAPKELPPHHFFQTGKPVIEITHNGFKAYAKKRDLPNVIAALRGET